MPTCQTCGEHVSRDYIRVCTDGTLTECPHCNGNYMDTSPASAVSGTLYSLR